MDAARELFAEHGVSGVTTQQVADRADIAIGTLYLHASTKAELLILVLDGVEVARGELAVACDLDVGVALRERCVPQPGNVMAGAVMRAAGVGSPGQIGGCQAARKVVTPATNLLACWNSKACPASPWMIKVAESRAVVVPPAARGVLTVRRSPPAAGRSPLSATHRPRRRRRWPR